jgi:hypothetical protein
MLYLVQESRKAHKYTEWQNTEFLNVTSGAQLTAGLGWLTA